MRKYLWIVFLVTILVTSCASGKLFGLTFTPSLTSTSTPTLTSTSTSTFTPTFTPSPTYTPTPSPTQFGGGSGQVTFTLYRTDFVNLFPALTGDFHRFIANIDGTGLSQVSDNNLYPYIIYSPNGRQVLLLSGSHCFEVGYMELSILDLESINSKPQLIISGQCIGLAYWVDNAHIFYTILSSGKPEWFVMNMDGTGKIQLSYPDQAGRLWRTYSVNPTSIIWEGALGPDKNAGTPYTGVWRTPLDGSPSENIFKYDGHFDQYSFSSDGTKVLYYYIVGFVGENYEVDLQFSDLTIGSGFRNLLHLKYGGYRIIWLRGDLKVLLIPECGNLCDPPYNTTPGYILSIPDLSLVPLPLPDYDYLDFYLEISLSPDNKLVTFTYDNSKGTNSIVQDDVTVLNLDTMTNMDGFLSKIDIFPKYIFNIQWVPLFYFSP